jgi:DHA1 family inner membrane transport protein
MADRLASGNWIVPIAALLLATFSIVSAELVIAGLLPTLAGDLGVDIPSAGLLITGYAIGVAVFGPVLAVSTSRVPRKTLLLAMMAIFIAGNILCAISANYWTLLGARLLMSACHGLYFGVAMVIANRVAPPARAATAASLVVAGVTLAIIAGVPLGTAVGNAWGWRTTFWFIAAAGALASLVVAWLIPAMPQTGPKLDVGAEIRAALKPVLLLCYANFGVGVVAFFAVLSYVVPFLTTESGVTLDVIPVVLMATGIASFLGSLLGGRLGDWNPAATLVGALSLNIVLLFALSQLAANAWIAVALLCLFWLSCFILPAPLQSRVIREGKESPTLASTIMNTASQIGIATGSSFGGLVISLVYGYSRIPLFSIAFLVVSLAGVFALIASDRRRTPVLA